MKLAVLGAIALGEIIGVVLEILLAYKFQGTENFRKVFVYILWLSPLFIISFVLLLLGYIYGYRVFSKIWVITIISWSAILVAEPLMNYIIFHEVPSGRTLGAALLAVSAIILAAW